MPLSVSVKERASKLQTSRNAIVFIFLCHSKTFGDDRMENEEFKSVEGEGAKKDSISCSMESNSDLVSFFFHK